MEEKPIRVSADVKDGENNLSIIRHPQDEFYRNIVVALCALLVDALARITALEDEIAKRSEM